MTVFLVLRRKDGYEALPCRSSCTLRINCTAGSRERICIADVCVCEREGKEWTGGKFSARRLAVAAKNALLVFLPRHARLPPQVCFFLFAWHRKSGCKASADRSGQRRRQKRIILCFYRPSTYLSTPVPLN